MQQGMLPGTGTEPIIRGRTNARPRRPHRKIYPSTYHIWYGDESGDSNHNTLIPKDS